MGAVASSEKWVWVDALTPRCLSAPGASGSHLPLLWPSTSFGVPSNLRLGARPDPCPSHFQFFSLPVPLFPPNLSWLRKPESIWVWMTPNSFRACLFQFPLLHRSRWSPTVTSCGVYLINACLPHRQWSLCRLWLAWHPWCPAVSGNSRAQYTFEWMSGSFPGNVI